LKVKHLDLDIESEIIRNCKLISMPIKEYGWD